jgi:hypothetical protein
LAELELLMQRYSLVPSAAFCLISLTV